MSNATTERFRDLATRVAPSVLTPDFAALQSKARRRRTRQTSVVCLAAIAGVGLAIAVPTVGLRPGGSPSPSAGGGAKTPAYHSTATGLAFLTRSTGFRFTSRCPVVPAPCQLKLAATADGGRTWRARPAPSGVGGTSDPELEVSGPRTVLLIWLAERQVSTDGGLHWTAVRPDPARSVAAASPSDLVFVGCPSGGDCLRFQVLALDPATGVEAPLLNQPPLSVIGPDEARGLDGSIWVTGKGVDGKVAVAASHDGGQTWITRTLPGMRFIGAGPTYVVTLDGRRAYVVESADHNGAIVLRIARTDNSGRTWQSLAPARGPLEPSSAILGVGGSGAGVLPDGRLALIQNEPAAGVRVSSDGITFERAPGAPVMGWLRPFPGGMLAGRNGQTGVDAYITTDGRNWRALPRWDTGG